jgi:mono/diheme cytochrome c family protein
VGLQSSKLWGAEDIKTNEKPAIANDSPAIAKETSPKKKDPVLLPSAEGKQLIGNRKGNPSWGKMIFEKHCFYCHGKKGLGDGPITIGLEVSPPSYIRENGILYMTDQEIFETITYGRKTHSSLYMPPWGPNLSEIDRISVIAYIKQLARKTKKEMEEKEPVE